MVKIYELDMDSREYIRTISELHVNAFPHFFLTQLGKAFLRTLYLGYIEDENSGIIIAEENSRVLGIIAYSRDYSGFFKGLIKKHLFKFAICSMCAVIRHPSFIGRILGAFKKSDNVTRNENYVELAIICVDPRNECKGVGSSLIKHLINITDFNKFDYISLETDAENNDKVNRFYMNNGFVFERQYTTPEGRRMNEYRYTPGDKT